MLKTHNNGTFGEKNCCDINSYFKYYKNVKIKVDDFIDLLESMVPL